MTGDDQLATRLGLNKVQAILKITSDELRTGYELSVVRPEDK